MEDLFIMTKEEKCSTSQLGRKVIHYQDQEKRIYENELEQYLNNGWSLGPSDKHRKSNSKSHKGKSNNFNGLVRTEEYKEQISKTLKNKYDSGELVVWNKGKDLSDPRVYDNLMKRKQTMLQKYGTLGTNTGKSFTEEHRNKIGDAHRGKSPKPLTAEQKELKLTRQYLTRKKNNSFNKSQPEIDLYNTLLEKYDKCIILRQYKDNERYPFYCDFYIPSEDLFIELNAHWTHGGRPYDPNDEFCQKQLKDWQEKAKTSKFYQEAINTWTIRDVKKQEVAKENNLNYKVIY